MKNIASYAIVSLLVSGVMLGIYHFSGIGRPIQITQQEAQADNFTMAVSNSMPRYDFSDLKTGPADFMFAARIATPAVVHIKSIQTITRRAYDPFYDFFGMKPHENNARQQVSSGSGVIISPDGYIVTNNHVIKDADELSVTLNDNRSFKATVIGTDPSTDLGLIKIDADSLAILELANSDAAEVGEWVLAVGNPFSLASTATAGIVSAIGRDLEIIKDQMAIESFIQTDAAVNPGNSGGALVNLAGQLIGVNTAIASPTGTYAGYAFAVPANIVRKVVSDLKQYGKVQRAFLGLRYAQSLDGDIAKENNIKITEGVLVEGLSDNGGAAKAGIQKGDVITRIDGVKIKNDARLRELVGRNRPGDIIEVDVLREGVKQTLQVQLTDQDGNIEIHAEARNELLNKLGVELRTLTPEELETLGSDSGILVSKLYAGKLRQETSIKESFIIMKINETKVSSAEELVQILEKANGPVALTGFYPRSYRLYTYTVEL